MRLPEEFVRLRRKLRSDERPVERIDLETYRQRRAVILRMIRKEMRNLMECTRGRPRHQYEGWQSARAVNGIRERIALSQWELSHIRRALAA